MKHTHMHTHVLLTFDFYGSTEPLKLRLQIKRTYLKFFYLVVPPFRIIDV